MGSGGVDAAAAGSNGWHSWAGALELESGPKSATLSPAFLWPCLGTPDRQPPTGDRWPVAAGALARWLGRPRPAPGDRLADREHAPRTRTASPPHSHSHSQRHAPCTSPCIRLPARAGGRVHRLPGWAGRPRRLRARVSPWPHGYGVRARVRASSQAMEHGGQKRRIASLRGLARCPRGSRSSPRAPRRTLLARIQRCGQIPGPRPRPRAARQCDTRARCGIAGRASEVYPRPSRLASAGAASSVLPSPPSARTRVRPCLLRRAALRPRRFAGPRLIHHRPAVTCALQAAGCGKSS